MTGSATKLIHLCLPCVESMSLDFRILCRILFKPAICATIHVSEVFYADRDMWLVLTSFVDFH